MNYHRKLVDSLVEKKPEAIEQLKSIRDDLKKKIRDLDKPRRDKIALNTENERIKEKIKEKIKNLEKHIESGTRPEVKRKKSSKNALQKSSDLEIKGIS